MSRVVAALLAGGSLAAGFAVAEVTGVRALGGLVLLAAVAVCALGWRRSGVVVATGLVALYLVLFVASHLLAGPLGAWPAVALVSMAMAASSYSADRRRAGMPA